MGEKKKKEKVPVGETRAQRVIHKITRGFSEKFSR